jgi:hypothetical protein
LARKELLESFFVGDLRGSRVVLLNVIAEPDLSWAA